LREAVSTTVESPRRPKQASKQSWHDVISEFVRSGPKEITERMVDGLQGSPGLVGSEPLVLVLYHGIQTGSADLSQIDRAIGMDGSTRASLPDVAVWLFRELQAIRLTADHAPSPDGKNDE